jgi:hypothetical protein
MRMALLLLLLLPSVPASVALDCVLKHVTPPVMTCDYPNVNYRGADKSLARPGRKQATATEDFDVHISYL